MVVIGGVQSQCWHLDHHPLPQPQHCITQSSIDKAQNRETYAELLSKETEIDEVACKALCRYHIAHMLSPLMTYNPRANLSTPALVEYTRS